VRAVPACALASYQTLENAWCNALHALATAKGLGHTDVRDE
jgi:hypothetical protein